MQSNGIVISNCTKLERNPMWLEWLGLSLPRGQGMVTKSSGGLLLPKESIQADQHEAQNNLGLQAQFRGRESQTEEPPGPGSIFTRSLLSGFSSPVMSMCCRSRARPVAASKQVYAEPGANRNLRSQERLTPRPSTLSGEKRVAAPLWPQEQ